MAARSRRARPTAAVIALAIVTGITLLPIAWMALSAFKPDEEINRIPPTFLPHGFSLDNFALLFSQFNFGLMTMNSVIVSFTVVVISVVLGGSAAYGFSRYPFRGSGLILGAILLTRMVTPASLVLPLFLMMEGLHLSNTLFAVAVGITALNLPFVVWLLKPFFDALPREVEEAALLDGLGPLGVWWRMAVPIAGPGFKTVALFSFVVAWTDLLIPITMSTRPPSWCVSSPLHSCRCRDVGRPLSDAADVSDRLPGAEISDAGAARLVLGRRRGGQFAFATAGL
jgi:ABC-type glycerol-3-phosphate transport system permease component